MCGKCFSICGGRSEEENGRQKQSKTMVKLVEHNPLQALSDSRSLGSTAVTADKKAVEDISQEDVNKAAEAFINRFHRDLELQRTLSDSRYHGYLERST